MSLIPGQGLHRLVLLARTEGCPGQDTGSHRSGMQLGLCEETWRDVSRLS